MDIVTMITAVAMVIVTIGILRSTHSYVKATTKLVKSTDNQVEATKEANQVAENALVLNMFISLVGINNANTPRFSEEYRERVRNRLTDRMQSFFDKCMADMGI